MTDRLLKAALWYATRGVPVVPLHTPVNGGCSCRDPKCNSAGKHPRTEHGVQDATTDAAAIRGWWARWPDANVGIATGGDLDILDVDPRNGGSESLASLEAAHGALPPTYEVVTGGNGRHLYFRPNGTRVQSRKLAPGVEVLAGGKLAVAPPSLHASGRRYQQKPGSGKIAAVPEWLAALAAARPDAGGPRSAETPIRDGMRNDTLFRLACGMRARGMTAEAILAALLAENAARCVPPLAEDEVDKIAGSATRYDPGQAAEHLTDLGNARRLVTLHGEDLRHCSLWGRWLAWDGARWAKDETDEVRRRAKAAVLQMYAAAAAEPNEDKRKALAAHARRCEADGRLAAMVHLAESEPGIAVHPDDLDRDPWALNVLNGTLDLRTGALRPHRREDLFTRLAPVAWDPEATCPTWDTFLNRIFAGNADTIGYVQRGIGYSLTGDVREQCIFVGHGGGANGKTTFGRTLTDLCGDHAAWTPTETLLAQRQDKIPNDVARLKGVRLVAAAEAEGGRRLAEALVKRFTGGDKLVARFLHREFFEFDATFKIWFLVNHKPEIRGTDHALWRRIRLIPFTVTIPAAEQDKTLPDKLQAEASGILRWCVEGCLAWQRDGLGWAPEVKAASEAYRQEMDVLGQFLTECCTEGASLSVTARDLYAAYKEWTKDANEHAESQKWFGMRLTERGFRREKPTRGQRVWTWHGLALRSPGDDADSDAGGGPHGAP